MNLEQSSKKYHSNHSMVYSCQYHVIFCPKYRRKEFHPPLDTRLKELILAKQEAYGYRVRGMEVIPHHVHLLLDTGATILGAPQDLKAYDPAEPFEFPSGRARKDN